MNSAGTSTARCLQGRYRALTALVVAALSFLAVAPYPVQASKMGWGMESFSLDIAERMEAWQVPGMVVVVVQGDKVIHSQGYGVANAATHAPMTDQTVLAIGSMTKGMTALGVLQLAKEGRVDLDAPVSRYLPWFTLADSRGSQITLRQVLSNSAGLPSTADFDQSQDANALERRIRALADLPLCNTPGTSWVYANDGFNIAGLVIQQVAGMPYEEYMRTQVFERLGMQRTTFDPSEGAALGMAQGYSRRRGAVLPVTTPLTRGYNPAGMALSTASDIGQYVKMLLNDGSLAGAPGLPSGIVSQLWEPVVQTGDGTEYGLGWFLRDDNGVRIVNHPGGVVMGSMIILAPEKKVGVAVLMNRDVEMKVELAEELMRSLLRGESAESVSSQLLGMRAAGSDDVNAMLSPEAGQEHEAMVASPVSHQMMEKAPLGQPLAVQQWPAACACYQEDSSGSGSDSGRPLDDIWPLNATLGEGPPGKLCQGSDVP